MALEIEPVVIDFDAIDAEVARGKAAPSKKDDKETVTVETTAPDTPATDKTVLTPEVGVEKLKEQLRVEREGRLAAEARASEAAKGEAEARGTVQTTQLDQIKAAIAHTTQANDTLEAEYAAAAQIQDWAAAAKAQRKMAENEAALRDFNRAKVNLEKAPKPTPRLPTDPVEAYIANVPGMGEASKQWLRAHPEHVRTEDGREMLYNAHRLALKRGLKENTPDYFKAVEKAIEVEQRTLTANGHDTEAAATSGLEDEDATAGTASTPVQARTAPPAAPVSRNGRSSNTIKLSPDQVEMARASFPDSKTPEEDYARQLMALKKEGRIQ